MLAETAVFIEQTTDVGSIAARLKFTQIVQAAVGVGRARQVGQRAGADIVCILRIASDHRDRDTVGHTFVADVEAEAAQAVGLFGAGYTVSAEAIVTEGGALWGG